MSVSMKSSTALPALTIGIILRARKLVAKFFDAVAPMMFLPLPRPARKLSTFQHYVKDCDSEAFAFHVEYEIFAHYGRPTNLYRPFLSFVCPFFVL